ncbi:hypothetical protein ABZ565_08035 [Streptomyces sp. NPDC016469]|uniref:hypothetical protein n=1 Tax=Streptomyces sp. NPDC016469 TaxID=3157191 RepID=UPI0033C92ABC
MGVRHAAGSAYEKAAQARGGMGETGAVRVLGVPDEDHVPPGTVHAELDLVP